MLWLWWRLQLNFCSFQMDESDSLPPVDASTVTASRVRTTADSSMVPENMLDCNLLCFTAQTEFISSRLSSLFGPAQYLRPLVLLMSNRVTWQAAADVSTQWKGPDVITSGKLTSANFDFTSIRCNLGFQDIFDFRGFTTFNVNEEIVLQQPGETLSALRLLDVQTVTLCTVTTGDFTSVLHTVGPLQEK